MIILPAYYVLFALNDAGNIYGSNLAVHLQCTVLIVIDFGSCLFSISRFDLDDASTKHDITISSVFQSHLKEINRMTT